MNTAGVCFALSFTNAQGYYYCQRSHNLKLSEYIQQKGLNMFKGAVKSSLMSGLMERINPLNFFRGGGGASGGSSSSAFGI